jgi:PPOX class probable FMN-dependent enzyme
MNSLFCVRTNLVSPTRPLEMQITTLDELRTLYEQPSERVMNKDIGHIDQHIARIIELCPFVVIASTNQASQLDASPRGGAPGFIKVLDPHTLLIPDSPGNNRLDTLENILSCDQLGLLFLVPGIEETVRINGRAQLTTRADRLELCRESQRRPKLAIELQVQQAYLHCAKALMRSQLWEPGARVDRSQLPSMGQMLKDQLQLSGPVESQQEMRERYKKIL